MPVPFGNQSGMGLPAIAQQQSALPTQGQPQVQINMVPFSRAAKRHIEQGSTQTVSSWSSSGGSNIPFVVPTYGYLTNLWLTVTATGGVGATTAGADNPWNIFTNVLLTDVNGTPIINLDGYALYLARLLGGYRPFRPDQSSFAFSAVSGSNGNFKCVHELFAEFGSGGLGCLPNMDASSTYKLQLTLNSDTGFYSSKPATSDPNLSILLEAGMRARAAQTDPYGNAQETTPPSSGTVSYWSSQSFNVANGANNIILSRVGNIIRNQILVFRDNSGVRSTADSGGTTPTSIQYNWDAGQRYVVNVQTQRQLNYEQYGFDVPAGVVAFPNMSDPDGLNCNESGDEWIQTVGSSKLQLQFTSTAAGTLQVITNDIVPGSGNVFDAYASQLKN